MRTTGTLSQHIALLTLLVFLLHLGATVDTDANSRHSLPSAVYLPWRWTDAAPW